jgi:hypothetical protein
LRVSIHQIASASERATVMAAIAEPRVTEAGARLLGAGAVGRVGADGVVGRLDQRPTE